MIVNGSQPESSLDMSRVGRDVEMRFHFDLDLDEDLRPMSIHPFSILAHYAGFDLPKQAY